MALNQYDFGHPDMTGRRSWWGYGGSSAMSPGGGGGGYPGLPFWDPMYRSDPGLWTIMDALGRHDRGIADRARDLAYNEVVQQGDPNVYGRSFGPTMDLRTGLADENTIIDLLYNPTYGIGPLGGSDGSDGQMKVTGVDTPGFWSNWWDNFKGRAGKMGLATLATGNPFAGLLTGGIGATADSLKEWLGTVDWKNLFGEGNEKAARSAFFESLAETGLGDGVADILAGMYDDRAREPGADEPGVDGSPGVGRSGGNGPRGGFGGPGGYGLPPGGYMGNPNISGMSSYMMEVAGGPSIPIIQGPQWVGPPWDPEQNMTGYPQFDPQVG